MTRSTVVGTVLQLAMVLGGHFVPAIKGQFAAGGMTISAVAGLLYSLWTPGTSAADAAKGGAVAGGASAFLGILVSTLLKDVPASVLGFGTAGSVVTGIVGGLLGRFIRKS
jgi:hypothetical protein